MLLRRSVLGALAFAALALPATASAADPDQIVRWPLDVIDGAANGRTAPSADRDPAWAGQAVDALAVPGGRFGAAYDLGSNGVQGQGFEVGDRAALQPGSVTVMAWVRGSRPANRAILVAKGSATFANPRCQDNAYALKVGTNGAPEFVVGTGTGNAATHAVTAAGGLDPSVVWDGRWHAVAGTFDAATSRVSIALDGTVVGGAVAPRSTIDYGFYADDRELSVGRTLNADACGYASSQYAGQLDEVRLYNRALTAPELAYLQDPAATTPRELPVPGTPGPVDPGPTDPGSTPSDPAPAPIPVVPPGVPPTPAVPTPLAQGLSAFVPAFGAGAPSMDFDVLLLKVAVMMRDAVAESRSTRLAVSIAERELAIADLTARSERLMSQAGAALKDGVEVQIKTPANASLSVVASTLAVSERVRNGKIRTTEIALPTGVYPVDPKTGTTTAQFGVSPKAVAALDKSLGGDVLGVSLLVKPASLPASAMTASEAEQLATLTERSARLEAQVDAAMARLQAARDQLASGLEPARLETGGDRLISFSSAHGVPATVPAVTKRRAQATVAKRRKRFRALSRSRNTAVHAAAVLAVDDFARAGSRDAPTTAFAIKRCVKRDCPFAIGD